MNRTCLLIVMLSVISLGVQAPGQTSKGTRWAVLIGVNDYASLEDLKYCSRDMQALSSHLATAGFDDQQVFLVHSDAKDSKYLPFKRNIEKQLDLVLGFTRPNDMVVVAFSGHGIHQDKQTYLCPAEADVSDPSTLLPLDTIYSKLKGCQANLRVLLVDACRNDPRPAGRKSGTPKQDLTKLGEAFKRPPEGIVLLSSCAPGEISYESKELGNGSGVFIHYFLDGLAGQADSDHNSQVSIGEAAAYAGRKTSVYVARTYNDSQRPFLTGNLSTDVLAYSLVPRVGPRLGPKRETVLVNSIGMKLAYIPAGEFLMGSGKSPEEIVRLFDLDKDDAKLTDEHPQHRVRITKPYYLGVTEVTQGQWESVMETRPWSGKALGKEGRDYPATYVSWEDATEFCERLSRKEGASYRLPTEAEWEYACRSGTTTVYSFGDDASRLGEYAWCFLNASDVGERYAHEVGQKKPNGFGLYDMHGNVWEWCSDWYDDEYYETSPSDNPTGALSVGSYRVLRGGGWFNNPGFCRSACRRWITPVGRDMFLGFRVALVPAK